MLQLQSQLCDAMSMLSKLRLNHWMWCIVLHGADWLSGAASQHVKYETSSKRIKDQLSYPDWLSLSEQPPLDFDLHKKKKKNKLWRYFCMDMTSIPYVWYTHNKIGIRQPNLK